MGRASLGDEFAVDSHLQEFAECFDLGVFRHGRLSQPTFCSTCAYLLTMWYAQPVETVGEVSRGEDTTAVVHKKIARNSWGFSLRADPQIDPFAFPNSPV
jgi:hypothetical protein